MSVAVPDERREPMWGVTISCPAGFRIIHARTSGWTATVEGSTSAWRGGLLAHFAIESRSPRGSNTMMAVLAWGSCRPAERRPGGKPLRTTSQIIYCRARARHDGS